MPEAIRTRHARSCASRTGQRCNRTPSHATSVYIAADRKKVRRSFPTQTAARAWQRDSRVKADRGTLRAIRTPTLAAAAEDLIEGMKDNSVRARGDKPFRAPVIREYESMLRRRVVPTPLAKKRLSQITHADLVYFVRDLHRQGLSPSSIRNTFDPIRVIFREAAEVGLVPANPMGGAATPERNGEASRAGH